MFGCIADMLVPIYEAAGFQPLLKWVDDFFIVHLPGQCWSEQDFMDLTGAIGVPWSVKKTRPLSTIQRYISLDWDLTDHTVAIPLDKLSWVLAGTGLAVLSLPQGLSLPVVAYIIKFSLPFPFA